MGEEQQWEVILYYIEDLTTGADLQGDGDNNNLTHPLTINASLAIISSTRKALSLIVVAIGNLSTA
ncbi:hypothetical protein GOBAR_AA22785 [Gossypium barbadense]|uniref:Uncharacterized protein n=1 Tax=Gossypium barbadense TaxID=3634 RepID=A0A2P5X3H6_GOSBA|nr:hypothetical protein GOBAR_AA22785 [Gossypium barbadense]